MWFALAFLTAYGAAMTVWVSAAERRARLALAAHDRLQVATVKLTKLARAVTGAHRPADISEARWYELRTQAAEAISERDRIAEELDHA